MTLDQKRKKLELMRVQTARHELEFRVEERLEDIKRLEEHIKIQVDKETQLMSELAETK